jgi:DNA-binding response OmpR family regulator
MPTHRSTGHLGRVKISVLFGNAGLRCGGGLPNESSSLCRKIVRPVEALVANAALGQLHVSVMSQRKTILVIEDDEGLRKLLEKALLDEGFACESAENAKRGLELLQRKPAACILDVGLPDLDGFEVLHCARASQLTMPIVMLTALDATNERIRGLDLGADDYISKPFSLAELFARLRAVLRRSETVTKKVLLHADLKVDSTTHQAFRGETALNLTAKQFLLLEFFMQHPNEIVTRAMILKQVFGYDFEPGTNLVDVHVAHLRKQIDSAKPKNLAGTCAIQTIRGLGYMLGVNS